jgi:hypothetical protein
MIRKELEAARKKTKPRKTDLYDIFRAVMYVVKSGGIIDSQSIKNTDTAENKGYDACVIAHL